MVYINLFFVALISATLFPLGSEALLLYDISQNYNILLLVLFASVGNSLGSAINYFFGLKGEEYLLEKKLINRQKIDKATVFFDKYGGYSLLFSWMPLIGDPITFIAGVLHYNFKKFLLIVFFAKTVRYILVAIGVVVAT